MSNNLKNSMEFLLGQISQNVENLTGDVRTLVKNQAIIINKIGKLEKRDAWSKGFIAAAGLVGGLFGSALNNIKAFVINN